MRNEINLIWVTLRLYFDIQHGHGLCDAGQSLKEKSCSQKVVKEDIALQTKTHKHN